MSDDDYSVNMGCLILVLAWIALVMVSTAVVVLSLRIMGVH